MIDAKERLEILSKALGTFTLDRKGVNASFKCPHCTHTKKQKLVVKIDTGQYHCWVCNTHGSSISYLLRKLSTDVAARWDKVAGVPQRRFLDDPPPEDPPVEIPHGFRLLAESFESRDPDVIDCIDYVRDRGLSLRDMWYFKLGCVTRGYLSRRVIMPSFDADGKLNYWTARTVDEKPYGKYMNAKASRIDLIFNEINVDWRKEITLVEGPFDLTKCDTNATSILGSDISIKSALFQTIVRNKTPVILALDNDMQEKQNKWAKRLSEYDIDVKILDLGSKKDVGEMTKEEFLKAKSMAKPWNRFNSIINSTKLMKSGSIF
jgi:DNA primase